MSNILKNIHNIAKEIQDINVKLKSNKQITLVIVTKGRSISEIKEAILAGGENFAENYLQEALSKWVLLKEKFPKVKLHFIGGLQSNKLKKILNIFDVIQSIDRKSLIDQILKFKEETKNKEFFIEVKDNLYTELSNRSGVDINSAQDLIEYAIDKGLNVKGIMGIASSILNDSNISSYFKYLKSLKDYNSLSDLSIGMSNDYKLAIKEGSTMVRIGSKIFN